jgi:4a-hydroxytetrahydrobiopterin dehydratase
MGTQETSKGGNESGGGVDFSKQLAALKPGWEIIAGHHLQRTFKFPDFKQALAFTNRIGEVAEQQGHHPDIKLGWGAVEVQIWTHTADGLTGSDFELARSIDALL